MNGAALRQLAMEIMIVRGSAVLCIRFVILEFTWFCFEEKFGDSLSSQSLGVESVLEGESDREGDLGSILWAPRLD